VHDVADERFRLAIDCERIPEISFFGGLVTCGCGHSAGRHSLAGCDRRAWCRCRRTLSDIVEVELSAARYE
jgi:hypothetical protein